MPDKCPDCGMQLLTPTEYHPKAACLLFQMLWCSNDVRVQLRSVVEYGYRAGRTGEPIDFLVDK